MIEDKAINIGKSKFIGIEWYVAHFTTSIPQQAILSKRILNKVSTELNYVERSVFVKEVNTQKSWSFELGTEEGINVPKWITAGFHERDWRDSPNLNNDAFCRPPVTSAQSIFVTERNPDSAFL